ncbi:hypothetical protein MTR_4g046027 [Medicago truncatula]|uniref:Uncharacterized protein n=1 Tax=Medicago truncatula TaxID=3880 RepID=A0A072UUR0_MEDTR|nr:hypothetical protein MTR_4g046027 [Medicago truncatula]
MVASKGTGCHIGTWANIPLFGARWLKDGLFFTTYNFIFVLLAHAKVRDIIDQSMKLNASQIKLFVTVMRSIWKRRNLKLWQQKNETNAQVVERAISRAQHIKIHSLQKPASGRYKCNIDASFSSSMNCVGIGICIRDDVGEEVLAKTAWFSPLCDVAISETIGLHTTLE